MILAIYSVSIALVILAGYMMHVHQPGPGWVILAAVACGLKDFSWKEGKNEE